MAKVKLSTVVEGDILGRDVIVEDTVLFEAGTVLGSKTIRILGVLGVDAVVIEPRTHKVFSSMTDVMANVDERFSYVAGDPGMDALKHTVKDVILSIRDTDLP